MTSLVLFMGCLRNDGIWLSKNSFEHPSDSLLESEYKIERINIETSGVRVFAFDSNDSLFFANFLKDGVVGKVVSGQNQPPKSFIDLSEWLTSFIGRKPRIEAIEIDDDNRLLIAESGTGKLLRVSADARKLEILADSYDGYGFGIVKDLVAGKNGDLFVSSPYSGSVFRVRPEAGYVGVLNKDLIHVEYLSINPDGTKLVASEADSSRVVVFDLSEDLLPISSWTLVDFSPSKIEPKGLTFDDDGFLYVALGDYGEIRVYDLKQGTELKTIKVGGPAESIIFHNGFIYLCGGRGIYRICLPARI